jgi:hypothetical protein
MVCITVSFGLKSDRRAAEECRVHNVHIAKRTASAIDRAADA